MTRLLSLAFAFVSSVAMAQQPVVKRGSCPVGYYSQGSYCVPFSQSRQETIEKVGNSCPVGWYSQGRYCTRERR